MAKKIEEALWERFYNNGNRQKQVVLDMKAGYTLLIEQHRQGPHKSCGHWHGGRTYYSVISSRTNETKYFRSIETIARAMAGHII